MPATPAEIGRTVRVRAGGVELEGNLAVPAGARGVVLFAHGSGSSRFSPRNRFVAGQLRNRGLGTLLIDLLTADEEAIDERTAHLRFDIGMLGSRLADAAAWLAGEAETRGLAIGYFGASTGAAAALVAAARLPDPIGAIVSRGGRPDLAGAALERVAAPTLLIVGGADTVVIELNREAYRQLRCAKEIAIVPGASHLFEEPGALEEVARLAGDWLVRWLPAWEVET
jgi:pimeloyl-ACP methyl ester carboxylesterase